MKSKSYIAIDFNDGETDSGMSMRLEGPQVKPLLEDASALVRKMIVAAVARQHLFRYGHLPEGRVTEELP